MSESIEQTQESWKATRDVVSSEWWITGLENFIHGDEEETDEEVAAKAHLVAAAPELLTVAELGYELSTLAACINWSGGKNQKKWLDALCAKIEAFQPLAKAAIAKAKGE